VNRPTVLYIFTPPCTWCARNVDNLKTLVDKEGGYYRFIGLALSEQALPEYVAKNDLKLPVYSGLSPETLKAYRLGGTPQTIVISPEGKVLEDWSGAYVGDQKSQIEAFFHVSLPGLREMPKTASAKANSSEADQSVLPRPGNLVLMNSLKHDSASLVSHRLRKPGRHLLGVR
jgi:hypothetical protein